MFKVMLFTLWVFVAAGAETSGILSSSDLLDGKLFESRESIRSPSIGLSYKWHCLNLKKSKLVVVCENWGRHESEGPKGMFEVSYTKGGITHHFISRHADLLAECKCKARFVNNLIHKANEICVLGESFGISEEDIKNWDLTWGLMALKSDRSDRRNHDNLCD